MINLIKKISLAITLLTVSTSDVYGDCSPSLECEKNVCCIPCEPSCNGKGFISADLLYWTAYQDGLYDCFPREDVDYIYSDGDIVSKFKGKGKDLHFKWDPGFRLGTGYQFSSGWDIAAYWTHFHSHANRHHRSEYSFENAHEIKWNLDFEVVDLLIAYEVDLGSCFSLRPFAGVRGAQIKQKLHTHVVSGDDYYFGSSSDVGLSSYSNSQTTARLHNREKFQGIGPLIGLELDWNIGSGFSVYGNASVAALYGHFHLRAKESNRFVDGAEFSHTKWHIHACQAVFDAGLGVRWQTCFCSNVVWFQLGLEHHRYFNQNRFGRYGDLCLDGANFSAGIAF